MTNEQGEKLVEFTVEGRLEAAKECFPELSEQEAIDKFSTFIKYIILK